MGAHLGSFTQSWARLAGLIERVSWLGLATCLAACAAQPAAPPPVAQKPRPVVQHQPRIAHKPVSAPKQKPSIPTAESGPVAEAKPDEMAEPNALATESAARPVPSTVDLIGLDQQRATTLLGAAVAIDNRSPATVWHYRSEQCQLDLVFYMEMKTGRMRSLHYNFGGDAGTPEKRRACLQSIIGDNRKPEAS